MVKADKPDGNKTNSYISEVKTMDFTYFQENLKRLMSSRGFSMKALSEEVGITAATISRYLSGNRTPDLLQIVKIASYFNVSIDWLLGLNGDKFEVMPKEIQDIAHLYTLATPDDRRVVQAVLHKYIEEE